MSSGTAGVTGLKFLKAVVWVVYALATAAIVIVAFAFFLLLFNASTDAGFAEFIYTTGERFAGPFVGMIEPTELDSGGIVAWSALFAIAAYAVLAWFVGSVLNSISGRIYRQSLQSNAVQPTAAQPIPSPAPQPAPVEPANPAKTAAPADGAAPTPEPAPADPQDAAAKEVPPA